MNEIRLGMQVAYTAVFRRVIDPSLQGVRKYWEPEERVGGGIVVGKRYLQNGLSESLGEDGYNWVPSGVQFAVLVANNPWRVPVPVPLLAMRRVPTETEKAMEAFRAWADRVAAIGRAVGGGRG